MIIRLYSRLLIPLLFLSCGHLRKQTAEESAQQPVGPAFCADSAYRYCEEQCAFGPRTMNSPAHDACEQWIASKFRHFGLQVTTQRAVLTGYDGTRLQSTNIIASYKPELEARILVCAHWDSRPWADNDPDPSNWHKPVMAANDAASGVAVMLELARLLGSAASLREELSARPAGTLAEARTLNSQLSTLNVGVDFICFDAEDYGFPQWETADDPGDTWALGAQYWAANPHKAGYKARFGILLDMVGGQGAQFYREGMSKHYASHIVDKVWRAAQVVGYGSQFPLADGGYITDDHIPVNTVARIPCIDIIPYYPDCAQSSFGPTWHTVSDDIDHIDPATLKAVGQTVIQVLFTEN